MKRYLLLCLLLTGCLQSSSGEKVGIITRISREGIIPFCKTWEVEMVRGGLVGGSGTLGSSFRFTVSSDELLQKLKEALESQKEVKIFYHQDYFLPFGGCQSKSDAYFLDDIKPNAR